MQSIHQQPTARLRVVCKYCHDDDHNNNRANSIHSSIDCRITNTLYFILPLAPLKLSRTLSLSIWIDNRHCILLSFPDFGNQMSLSRLDCLPPLCKLLLSFPGSTNDHLHAPHTVYTWSWAFDSSSCRVGRSSRLDRSLLQWLRWRRWATATAAAAAAETKDWDSETWSGVVQLLFAVRRRRSRNFHTRIITVNKRWCVSSPSSSVAATCGLLNPSIIIVVLGTSPICIRQ